MIRLIARMLGEKLRTRVIFNFLTESALMQQGSTIEIKMTVNNMTASEIVVEKVGENRFEATLGEEKDWPQHVNEAPTPVGEKLPEEKD